MVLTDSAQVALGLLQTIGLLIPVIFLSIRELSKQGGPLVDSDVRSEGSNTPSHEDAELVDVAPNTIRGAWVAIASLSAAGVLAAVVILLQVEASLALIISLGLLVLGLVSLAIVFYWIRSSFTIEVM